MDSFGVAGVEEGVHLREAGVEGTEIIVLSPVPYSEIPILFDRSLVPSVTELVTIACYGKLRLLGSKGKLIIPIFHQSSIPIVYIESD